MSDAIYRKAADVSECAGGKALGLIGIIPLLVRGLSYPGQPHVLARFRAAKSPEHIIVARRVAMSRVITVLIAAIIFALYEMVPGVLFSALAIWLVSTPERKRWWSIWRHKMAVGRKACDSHPDDDAGR